MGVGGGCIQSETSQQAVEGCTHQRCLGKAEAASAQGGVYTWVSSKGWVEVNQVRKKKGHCKQRDKGCMMTLLEHPVARKRLSESHSVMSDSLQAHGLQPVRASVHGILQARLLEWVAMPISRVSFQPSNQTHISYVSCIGRQILYHLCHPWLKYFAVGSLSLL